MSIYLAELWATIEHSGLANLVTEIIFVDDGSTDNTAAVIESFKSSESGKKIILKKQTDNKGRYLARKVGAEMARGEHLLFLDTRVSLPDDFGQEFIQVCKHSCAMCMIEIDTKKSLFNLYWQRTHEFIFRRHFKDAKAGFYINSTNYETYAKGTTGFYCSKTIFLNAYAHFNEQVLQNDDTPLLKAIAETDPIWVHAKWRIIWEPRQEFNAFLDRLWERGPSFVEYHLITHKGAYYKILMVALAYILITMTTMIFMPLYGKYFFNVAVLALVLSVFLFAKSIREFIKMLPLHVIVCLVAGFSIIRGVYVNLRRKPLRP